MALRGIFCTKTLGFLVVKKYRESKGVHKSNHSEDGETVCHRGKRKKEERDLGGTYFLAPF